MGSRELVGSYCRRLCSYVMVLDVVNPHPHETNKGLFYLDGGGMI